MNISFFFYFKTEFFTHHGKDFLSKKMEIDQYLRRYWIHSYSL